MVLRDPTVEAAVMECARGGVLREGLAFDRCDVGCVLNVQPDHLGLKGARRSKIPPASSLWWLKAWRVGA